MSTKQRNRALVSYANLETVIRSEKRAEQKRAGRFSRLLPALSQLQGQPVAVFRHDEFSNDQLAVPPENPQIRYSLRERVPVVSRDA